MSGWIKLDKGLIDSLRFRRYVKALRHNSNALRNASPEFAVTVAFGALGLLWRYADGEIDEQNVIAATCAELDEMVGVEGFSKSLPDDWLLVIDDQHVQLPDFLEHNGSSAKQRSDNAKRQARHRHKVNAEKGNGGVTGVTRDAPLRNGKAAARPDQTRPDQTISSGATQTDSASDDGDAGEPKGIADTQAAAILIGHESDGPTHTAPVDPGKPERQVMDAYPRHPHGNDWMAALRLARSLVENGQATWQQLIEAVTRYASYVAAGGVTDRRYVMTPVRFFTAGWANSWDPPAKAPTEAETRKAREREELQRLMDGRAGRGLATFREPFGFEGPDAYATALRQAERDLPRTPNAAAAAVTTLVAAKRMPTS